MEGKCPGRSYCIGGVSGVLLVHQSLFDSLESAEDHQTDSTLHSQRSAELLLRVYYRSVARIH